MNDHEIRIKELEAFCSEVSHEIKAPLNVMYMLAQTIKGVIESGEYDDALRIADMIQQKALQLTALAERLLEFSRMSEKPLNTESIDTAALVAELAEEFQKNEPKRSVTLNIGALPKIQGDRILIEVLFGNILSNAFKFTSKKSQTVIDVYEVPSLSHTVISVRDNGAGFDGKDSDELFRMFGRLHSDDSFEGSGVGLALCRKIMERHGGEIKLIGEKGKGAAAMLCFPK